MAETWTDDDGVTHDMNGIVACCFVDVKSKIRVCQNDDPPRTVTCLQCLAGDSWEKLFSEMLARGVTIDNAKLEEARKLCAMEKIPLGR